MSAEPTAAPESAESPLVSILIVNWNSKDYVRKCLASLRTNCGGLSHEVIVVDGASFDGCGGMVAKEFPEVRFVQSKDNVGFGRANNLAFEHSRGKYVLLLNPDTEVPEHAISILLHGLQHLPQAGMVGPRLLNTDGTLQYSCTAFPSLFTDLAGSDWLRRRFPHWRVWGTQGMLQTLGEPVEVEVMVGACLLMPSDLYRAIGGFSPEFFMYSEDVDLCHKVRREGFRRYYVPQAKVLHHGGGGSIEAGSSFTNLMFRESRWRFYRKTRGLPYALLFRGLLLLSSLARLVLAGLRRLTARDPEQRRQWADRFVKWLTISRWCVGGEGWVRTLGGSGAKAGSRKEQSLESV